MRGKLLAEPVRCQRCSSLIEVREYISGSMDIEVKHNLSSWYGEDEVLLLGDGDRSSGIVRIVQQSLKREQCSVHQ